MLTTDRVAASQPLYRAIFSDSTTQNLLDRPSSTGPLLLEYDKLDRLGRAFRHLVDTGRATLDQTATTILDGIYDPRNGAGQPDIIIDGRIAWHSYFLLNADAEDPRVSYEGSAEGVAEPFDPNSFRRADDSLHITYYGGAAWAGLWFGAGTGQSDRQSPDFSMYSKLLLELRGDAGGEKIVINMEDRDDPADGTSTRYEIELSDDWQTFKIDLSEFETANLEILSVPVGFVFFEEPVSFSVRTARFIRAD